MVLRNPDEAARGFEDNSIDLVRLRTGVGLEAFMSTWATKLTPEAIILTSDRSLLPAGMAAIDLSGDDGLVALSGSTEALAPFIEAMADSAIGPKVLAAYDRLGRNCIGGFVAATDALLYQDDETLLKNSPLFDPGYYLQSNPDIAAARVDPLSHYLSNGGVEGRAPHPLFDAHYYLSKNPEVAHRKDNPLVHYLRFGHRRGARPNPVFDPAWYRRQHPEIGQEDPLTSYVEQGSSARFWPSATFDPRLYVSRNKHLAASNADPLAHYLQTLKAGHEIPLTAEAARPRTVILVHVADLQDWERVAEHLDQCLFDELLVTYPAGDKSVVASIREEQPTARLIPATNETEGFFAALPILAEYEGWVCRFNAIQPPSHGALRTYLMGRALLGQRNVSAQTLHNLALDDTIGLAGPKTFYLSASATSDGLFRQLQDGMEICSGRPLPGEWGYFSGGSFWFRPSVVKSWLTPHAFDFFTHASENGFDSEGLLERLIGASAEALQARVALIDPFATTATNRVEVGNAIDQRQFHDLESYLVTLQQQLAASTPGLANPETPRWTRPAKARLGVNFVAPVEIVNGLGVSARGYHDALLATGLPINVHPWTRGFEHVNKIKGNFASGAVQPITITHLNLDILHDAKLLDAPPLCDIATHDTFNIALPYWELLSVKPEWKPVIDRFDEIWVASEFMARSIRAVSKTPVRVIRPAIGAPETSKIERSHFGIPEKDFSFFYNADASSVFLRKNPECLVRAYIDAFSEADGASLTLKLNYASANDQNVARITSLIGHRNDIRIINEILPLDELHGLIQSIDCYVSPHRSEGLGLTVIEAMFAKKPVIATAFGGVEDFIAEGSAYAIPHRMIEVGEGAAPYPPGYLWADPVMEELSKLLRHVKSNPEKARKIGEAGFEMVHKLFSIQVASAETENALRAIWKNAPTQTREVDRATTVHDRRKVKGA
jgi:glycosyltransferase involved in cell wall biosynthesis